MNRVCIAGRFAAIDALRYTPAGIPIVRAVVAHESEQTEAGVARRVRFELECVAVERTAQLIAAAPLGTAVRLKGFLAPKGRSTELRTTRIVQLHITDIEFEATPDDGSPSGTKI